MNDQISELKRLIPTDIEAARAGAALLLQNVQKGGSDTDRAAVYHLTGLVHFYAKCACGKSSAT
jgi:hypothetical protein